MPNGAGIHYQSLVTGEQVADLRAAKRKELGVGERPLLLVYSRLFEFETGRLVAMRLSVSSWNTTGMWSAAHCRSTSMA